MSSGSVVQSGKDTLQLYTGTPGQGAISDPVTGNQIWQSGSVQKVTGPCSNLFRFGLPIESSTTGQPGAGPSGNLFLFGSAADQESVPRQGQITSTAEPGFSPGPGYGSNQISQSLGGPRDLGKVFRSTQNPGNQVQSGRTGSRIGPGPSSVTCGTVAPQVGTL